MKQVFNALDEKSSSLSEDRRQDIASGIIHHVVTLNRNTEAQAFTDRALDLLIDYTIPDIAADTLKESEAARSAEKKQSLPLSEEPSSEISLELQHEDSISRSRIEECKAPSIEAEAVETTQEEAPLSEMAEEAATQEAPLSTHLEVKKRL